MSVHSNNRCGWTDLPEKASNPSQRSTRGYCHKKGIHFPMHLTVYFRTSANVVNMRICGIRVLVGPNVRGKLLTLFSHSLQPRQEIPTNFVRLIYHINLVTHLLHF